MDVAEFPLMSTPWPIKWPSQIVFSGLNLFKGEERKMQTQQLFLQLCYAASWSQWHTPHTQSHLWGWKVPSSGSWLILTPWGFQGMREVICHHLPLLTTLLFVVVFHPSTDQGWSSLATEIWQEWVSQDPSGLGLLFVVSFVYWLNKPVQKASVH